MQRSFDLDLKVSILPQKVCVAKFDGRNPCIIAATVGNKVLLHNLHSSHEESNVCSSTRINVNTPITALAAGPLVPGVHRDMLVVGGRTILTAFDVEENRDLFYREVSDGANCLSISRIPPIADPIVLLGGNCSLLGFGVNGNEEYWTVMGDNVSSLTCGDVNGDGVDEILAGAEDCRIRALKHENLLEEVIEADVVTGLCIVNPGSFAYSLKDGTLGVYQNFRRRWRIKSRRNVTCMFAWDMDNNGVNELITGWDDGKVQVRCSKTYNVLFEDLLPDGIAGIFSADCRLDGNQMLMACTVSGQIFGWLPQSCNIPVDSFLLKTQKESDIALSSQSSSIITTAANSTRKSMSSAVVDAYAEASLNDAESSEETYRQLLAEQAHLSTELFRLKHQYATQEQRRQTEKTALCGETVVHGKVPADTQVRIDAVQNSSTGVVELRIITSNHTVIRGVILQTDGNVSHGKSHLVYPSVVSHSIPLDIDMLGNMGDSLYLMVFVGTASYGSQQCDVFELHYKLPKFTMYYYIEPKKQFGCNAVSDSYVSFALPQIACQAVLLWLKKSFLFNEEIFRNSAIPPEIWFASLKTNDTLLLSFKGDDTSVTHMTIYTDSIELAAELVQDLCRQLKVTELESTVHFPRIAEIFKQALQDVQNYNAARLRFAGDMAEQTQLIKNKILKTEEIRFLNDTKQLKQQYVALHRMNCEVMAEYKKCSSNHEALLEKTKQINQMVQNVANLRVGLAKAHVIAACRTAIKENRADDILEFTIRMNSLSSQYN